MKNRWGDREIRISGSLERERQGQVSTINRDLPKVRSDPNTCFHNLVEKVTAKKIGLAPVSLYFRLGHGPLVYYSNIIGLALLRFV
jgi:hypothetical protein